MLIHPHALGNIMGEPTAAAKKAGEVLSQGAKTYLRKLAKESVYGYRAKIDNKYIKKGLAVEDQSIELYNSVFFTDYTKNSVRIETDILSGECDILDDDLVIDIKSSWSLDTFPSTPEDAHDDGYEWQLRAYLMLYDKPYAELAFCLVSTPDDLIGYEDPELHYVDHIPAHMRITKVRYERDAEKEQKIIDRCKAAQVYFDEQVERIKQAHNY